ncbi:MAG: porin [Phycisphaerales bacterium JB040]
MQRIAMTAGLVGLACTTSIASNDDTRWYESALRADAAGYDSFQISDGEASLTINGYLQTRYVASFSDGFDSGEDVTTGFTQPRLRLGVKGNLTDKIGYVLGTESAGGTTSVLDANIAFALTDELTLRIGQYVLSYTREQDVSASRQVAVERSVTHSFFSGGRSQGAELEWQRGEFRLRGSLSDGFNALSTPTFSSAEADIGLTARVEWKPEGAWSQFRDFQGWRGGERGLLFGAATHYQSTGDTGAATGATALDDVFALTADVSAEFNGAGAMAGWYFMDRETTAGDFTEHGLVLQGSVFVNDTTEVFARWDAIFVDSDRSPTADDLHTITAGATFFFIPESHAAKLTVDAQYMLSDLNDSPLGTSDSRAIFASSDSQVALRAQLQIRF